MEEIRSKVDSETTYKVTDKHITVVRGGDSLQVAFVNLEDTIKVFREDIKEEILRVRDEKKGHCCPVCNSFFLPVRRQKYCSKECCRKATIARSKEWREKHKEIEKPEPKKSRLNEICKEAKEHGMSYGQYQAMKYKESMRW